mmetsp:Transcript_77790/g.137194  ORF Transcript_77790/g.137194 Transcript_77790/m.137194 type:complete len:373 (-) Transcript_77790:14-1132(-)
MKKKSGRAGRLRQEEVEAVDEASQEGGSGATVVVGTYEGGLLGFNLDDGAQTFGYAPHTGCIKALHCSQVGKLASGSTDNTIRLFDLAKGVELGELQEHEDSVCALQFWGTSTLVTGSSDGQVCIWRCGDYELLLKFRGHKAAVACLAIHPSGRMMASAGRDGRLQLWDLTRGTSAAHLSVNETVDVLEWSPSGKSIAALSSKELQVVEIESSTTMSFKDPNSTGFMRVPLVAAAFLGEGVLALGDGKGEVRILVRAAALEEVCKLPIDDVAPGTPRGRVKALLRADQNHLLVGMSSGSVEVWRYPAKKMTLKERPAATDFTKVQVVDTQTRLTCLAVWKPGQELSRLPDEAPKGKRPAAENGSGKKKKRKT